MTTTPPSWPTSTAIRRMGVSERRLRKPVWMSRARSVPAFIVANSAPWMNGTARAKATNEVVGKPGSRFHCKPATRTSFVLLLGGALERAAGLGEEDIVERRLVQLQLLDLEVLAVERADDSGQVGL